MLFSRILVSGERDQLGGNWPTSVYTATDSTDRSVVDQPEVTIDNLPDEVFLRIFDLYKEGSRRALDPPWRWQTLAHVCRRWRYIILESPQRLCLQVACSARTPTRKSLDIWPPFPIAITSVNPYRVGARGEENIIAALEQRDRVCEITLFGLKSAELERFAAVMEEPLPTLTHLILLSFDRMSAMLPRTFLGGSAPSLRLLALQGIPFPALPDLLLSANRLRFLDLDNVPHIGYVSPQAMAASLLALPNLTSLVLGFQSPQSRPLQMSLPPLTRAVLPVLTHFEFKGVSEYLEEFVARVDTPLLENLQITLFLDLVFDIPRLQNFVDRTKRLRPLDLAEVQLCPWGVRAAFGSTLALRIDIKCKVPDWQLSSMARVCDQLSHLLSQVECLDIVDNSWHELEWQDNTDPTPWLELLNPFVSVKSLRVSEMLGLLVASALGELAGESVTEVLPALHHMSLEGSPPSPVLEAINPFVATRQFSNNPVVIQPWERTSNLS